MDTDAFVEHLFDSALGTFDALTIYVGDQLGLYDASAPRRPADRAPSWPSGAGIAPSATPRSGSSSRPSPGSSRSTTPALRPTSARYVLRPTHAAVLADPDSLAYLAPFARMIAGGGASCRRLLEAYRTGGGVAGRRYGDGRARPRPTLNRPLFLHSLGSDWLPALPVCTTRAAPTARRVADVGCGDGWSSVGMALAYPDAHVDGYDVDPASVDAARGHAATHGLADRVDFHAVDAARRGEEGAYDLVPRSSACTTCRDPVGVLRGCAGWRARTAPCWSWTSGCADEFTGAGDAVEQLMYGFSLLICLPDGLSHEPLRRHRHRDAARHAAGYAEAGFATSRCCRSSTTCSGSTGSRWCRRDLRDSGTTARPHEAVNCTRCGSAGPTRRCR